jgi:putative chitinase
MAKITDALGASIKSKVLGSIAAKTVEKTQGNPNTLLKIIGKNFMSLPGFARDLNVARQNMQRLVKLEGGVPAKGADAHFLKEGDRATKLDVQVDKEEKKKATPAPKKGKSLISNLKDKFSASKILKSLTKYLVIGAVIGVIFIAFKDTFVEWAKGLWSAISEKFSEFTAGIKQWFADTIQPILDKVKELIQPLIDAVSNFIGKIGDWFKEKIGWFAETFSKTFAFIKKVIDKVSEVIESIKGTLKGWAEKLLSNKATAWIVPNFVKDMLGLGKKETPIDDSAERKKLERQQAEASETERVRKLEKEKQYTGDDEIVRARLGLPPKTETMRREEEAKRLQPVETAPPPESIVVPSPAGMAPPAPPVSAPTPITKPAPAAAPSAAAPSPGAKAPSSAETKPAKVGSSSGKQAMIGAMDSAKITDPTARAAIMAQVGHESGGFTTLSENLNYKAPTLMKLFPKKFSGPDDAQQVSAGGPQKVAERLYGGRMGNAPEGGGEGFQYRGRGFIQLTGKQNYTRFGYANDPEQLTKPEGASESAIKYMMGYKGNWADVKAVTKFVNGGYIGLADRQKHFEEYLNDPSITKVGAVASAPSGGSVASSSSTLASDHRQQAKPQTPIIINAPTNNKVAVTKNEMKPPEQKDTGKALTARVA